jgi:hypothetical protein
MLKRVVHNITVLQRFKENLLQYGYLRGTTSSTRDRGKGERTTIYIIAYRHILVYHHV